jgi:large subunit ribosomal protein L25
MEKVVGVTRDKVGTANTRRLRRTGMVPGVIYGHGKENVSFAISAHDIGLVLGHGEHVVEMDLGGETSHYLIKSIQRDALDMAVVHVDFARVNLDETVQVTVPVVLRGKPAGEVEGGVLTQGLTKLSIECLVTNIPEEIRVRVNDMKVGQVLRVKDLPAIPGGKILSNPESMVATCQLVAEEVEAPAAVAEGEETAAAEPEVIAKGKEEEEAAEE